MLRKLAVCLSLVALALASAPLMFADSIEAERALKMKGGPVEITGPLTRDVAHVQTTPNKNVPTGITYDDGVVTAAPAVSSFCYGNQFNSASGMAVKSFSVSFMSFYIASAAGTDNVFLSVFGPVSVTAAPVLSSVSVPLNNGPGAFNSFTFTTPLVGTGSFLAGVWFITGDTVGLGSGTVNGQGHHGMLINDIAGTGFSTLPGLNALVRAATANVIPVELMNFSISAN